MTAALNIQDLDWRSRSACDAQISDRAYDTVQDLIEGGMPEESAREAVAAGEAAAKQMCAACPFRAQCRDEALREEGGELGFGVWGGMGPAERLAYRSTWLKIKKIQGLETAPNALTDPGVLHPNPGVNATYKLRRERAQAAKDRLLLRPGFVLDTGARNYGRHEYAELLQLLDMVLANPASSAASLGGRIGRSAVWFSGLLRYIGEAMEVPGCAPARR